jgi:hypothetical protein
LSKPKLEGDDETRNQAQIWRAWLNTEEGLAWACENGVDEPITDPLVLARIAAIIRAAATDEDYIAALKGDV